MATLEDLLDDLRDRLNDDDDSDVSITAKIRAINHGIKATWPLLYRTVRDSTLVYDEDLTEYAIPSAVGSHTKIVRVEIETDDTSSDFQEMDDYDIIPGLTDPILAVQRRGRFVDGASIRITACKRLTELVLVSDTYDGPPGTEELPVLYAMGLITGRRIDDRIDHRRYKSTQDANGVGTGDVMDTSQFWFAQFELLLDRMAMPPLAG